MKKKMLALLLSTVLLFNLSACGSSGSSEAKGKKSGGIMVLEEPPKETEVPAVPLSDSGDLGSLAVSIGELEHIKDYDGNAAILIHFTFTNNSDENKSAMISLSYKAFQNGIGLKDALIMDKSIYNPEDLMKDIRPGATIELAKAYILSSETAPVDFIVCESITFDDTKLGKMYEIAQGGETVFSVAPGLESAVEIDRYSVSINSYNLTEDYEGKKVLVLNMGYTNNSKTDSPFYVAIDVEAFQNGIELEQAYITDDYAGDIDNNYLNVLPGAGLGVAKAFVLDNETATVDIEITPMFSFNDDKITTQINLAK